MDASRFDVFTRAFGAGLSGRRLAKVCLELGGKNPLIVCDDADLTLAAEHAVASAFIDAGQRCAAGSRLIVFDRVYDAFREAMLKRAAAVKVGSGPQDECGPVISRQSLERLLAAVDGAVQRGARLLAGGRAVDALAPGYYMAPTVLEHVSPDDELSQQELFGPVTCLYRVKGFTDAIELANGTAFGLTGAEAARAAATPRWRGCSNGKRPCDGDCAAVLSPGSRG